MKNLGNSFTKKPESPNPEEKESGKRENITLEIDGQKIEAVKYYFEYPERIQKETGILGYERVKILNDSFKKIENLGVRKILPQLSNGEYPNYTYNHMMGGFADTPEERAEMNNDFKDDKFFLQKIYDISRIEKKLVGGYEAERIFNYPPRLDYDGYHDFPNSVFSLIDKENLEQLDNSKHIGKIIDYKDKLNGGQYFASTHLNVAVGDFWHGIWGKEKEELAGFGFPVFGESYFNNYIEESLEVLLETKKIKEVAEIANSVKISTCFFMYLMSQYQKEVGSGGKENWSRRIFLEKIFAIAQNFLKKNNIDNIEHRNHMYKTLPEYLEMMFSAYYFYHEDYYFNNFKLGGSQDFYLPIFIEHDKFPQLSWGHAKYAHYKNEKSFNFFKFKHADHLPVKQE